MIGENRRKSKEKEETARRAIYELLDRSQKRKLEYGEERRQKNRYVWQSTLAISKGVSQSNLYKPFDIRKSEFICIWSWADSIQEIRTDNKSARKGTRYHSFCVKTKADKWLKGLLLIHGIFFITCFMFPMLGLFTPDMVGAEWIGTTVLEFWCVYFMPIGILSFLHFSKCTNWMGL